MNTIISIIFVLWLLFSFIKYLSIFWEHIYWPIKYGRRYHEEIVKNNIEEANRLYNRKRKGFGDHFNQKLFPFNLLFGIIYSYQFVFMINSIIIGLSIYVKLFKANIILLIIIYLLIGLFILTLGRIVSYFYLGIYAFMDLIHLSLEDDCNKKINILQRNYFVFFADLVVIILSFAFMYLGVNYYYIDGFKNVNLCILWQIIDFIYFSIATITTTGYGDIVPKTECFLGKALISTQMLFSFLYLMIILQLISITYKNE